MVQIFRLVAFGRGGDCSSSSYPPFPFGKCTFTCAFRSSKCSPRNYKTINVLLHGDCKLQVILRLVTVKLMVGNLRFVTVQLMVGNLQLGTVNGR